MTAAEESYLIVHGRGANPSEARAAAQQNLELPLQPLAWRLVVEKFEKEAGSPFWTCRHEWEPTL